MSSRRLKHVVVFQLAVAALAIITGGFEAAVPPLPRPGIAAAGNARVMQQQWLDLSSSDPAKVLPAAAGLVGGGEEAVAFLRSKLKPEPLEPKQIQQLIDELNGRNKDKAEEQLIQVIDQAAPLLRKILDGRPQADQRRRVEKLMQIWEGADAPEQGRGFTVVGVLEGIGSEEARTLLKGLGESARPALAAEAKAATERLSRKPGITAGRAWNDLLATHRTAQLRAYLWLTEGLPEKDRLSAEEVFTSLQTLEVLLRLQRLNRLDFSEDVKPPELGVRAGIMQDDGKDTPLRGAVRDAVKILEETEKRAPIVRELMPAPNEAEKLKHLQRIETQQKEIVDECLLPLTKLEESLDAFKDDRAKEPAFWQAIYDLVVIHVHVRHARVLEYTAKLGEVRRDLVPALDKEKHRGWRVVAKDEMSDRDCQHHAELAQKLFKKLAVDHKGTLWEMIGLREGKRLYGLEWEPLAK